MPEHCTIDLSVYDGPGLRPRRVPVRGDVYVVWAVVKPLALWQVTHIPSGALVKHTSTKRAATALAKQLEAQFPRFGIRAKFGKCPRVPKALRQLVFGR